MNAPVRCISIALVMPVIAEDIPYGVELVTGLRTGYHQKGIELADDLIDLQLQSNITLSESSSLNIALWQGAEVSGDFQELGAVVGLTRSYDTFSFSGEVSYLGYESSIVSSGVEVSLGADYELKENIYLYGSLGYHSGAESFIAQGGVSGSHRLTDDSFIEAKAELNLANSYFSREGIYDLTSRVSYTYNVSSFLSATPFLSSSIPLDGEADFDLSAGMWLEVFF